MPKPGSEGHGISGHLSDRLRRKAPGGTLPLPLATIELVYVRCVSYCRLFCSIVGLGQQAWFLIYIHAQLYLRLQTYYIREYMPVRTQYVHAHAFVDHRRAKGTRSWSNDSIQIAICFHDVAIVIENYKYSSDTDIVQREINRTVTWYFFPYSFN